MHRDRARYSLLLGTGTQCYFVAVVNVEEYRMTRQDTEMLKGVLEGVVLAVLARRPAYGYEITADLRERGFTDLAEGTVYAILVRIEQRGLVDVEKVASEKGPPRKVFTLNDTGREQLAEFWTTWGLLADRLEQLRDERN